MMVAVLALAACAKSGQTGQAPVTEAEATRIAQGAEASFSSGDANRIMANYGSKAVMIDASNPTPTDDRSAQTGWAKTFTSMRPADYAVTDRHIQLVGPDAFVSSGVESFTVQAGAARPKVSSRFTDVYQRQGDGQWKIVHEHVSMMPTPAGQP
ncbi:nuclear transport factor 2 family protein [Sphingomonas ginkgonis]|nr:DUF4440 domain-containing protein [Sphingomonas ginkgonis]